MREPAGRWRRGGGIAGGHRGEASLVPPPASSVPDQQVPLILVAHNASQTSSNNFLCNSTSKPVIICGTDKLYDSSTPKLSCRGQNQPNTGHKKVRNKENTTSSQGFTSSPGNCTTTFTPASSGKPWELPLMTWSSSISVTILWNASFRMASPSAYLLPSAVILSSLLTCSVCPPLLAVAGIGHTSTTLPSSAATAQDTTAATATTTSNLRAIAGAILSLQETRQDFGWQELYLRTEGIPNS
uniref:Uncharacterized protein n=1 Tax=Oryza nivara TaxID=4536 RepID=A0A0E0HEH7_ORYNI